MNNLINASIKYNIKFSKIFEAKIKNNQSGVEKNYK